MRSDRERWNEQTIQREDAAGIEFEEGEQEVQKDA
jgi:hypothetical protein